jgi:lipoate-protein ligase A
MVSMTNSNNWRLIRSGYLPGAMNMALDDALLRAVADDSSLPVLRFYRWQPATLTLGYAQSAVEGVDIDLCGAAGVDVVRRPTGGRAVFHDREVTYAVIAPIGGLFGGSIVSSYQVIAGVLRHALCRFGLPAELVPGKPRGQVGRAVCFTAPAQHELLIDGCKVAGCAQKRRGNAFLQHGSIPLDLDLDLLRKIMPAAPDEDEADRFRCIGWLNRFASRPLSIDEVEAALIDSFAAVLGVQLTPDGTSAAESAAAAQLHANWYGNREWTLAGPGVRSGA